MSVAMETCVNNGGLGASNGDCISQCDSCDSIQLEATDDTGECSINLRLGNEQQDIVEMSSSTHRTSRNCSPVSADENNKIKIKNELSHGSAVDETVTKYDVSQPVPSSFILHSGESNESFSSNSIKSSCDSDDDAIKLPVASPVVSDNKPISADEDIVKAIVVISTASTAVITATLSTTTSTTVTATTTQNSTTAEAASVSAPRSVILQSDEARPMLIVKHSENNNANALSSIRPMAKLLQDTGLLLASERVFKYLVQIQRQKLKHEKTLIDLADSQLLTKLELSHSNIVSRNTEFAMQSVKRCVCGFKTESSNVMHWHKQCGEWGPGKCCMCNAEYSYKTRNMFERHMHSVHKQTAQQSGRPAKNSCQTCTLDMDSVSRIKYHQGMCKREFVLARNLLPQSSHKDIPLKSVVTTSTAKLPMRDVTIIVNSQMEPASTKLLRSRPTGGFKTVPYQNNLVQQPANSKLVVNKPTAAVTITGNKTQSASSNSAVVAMVSASKPNILQSAAATSKTSTISRLSSGVHLAGAPIKSTKQLFNIGGQLYSILTDSTMISSSTTNSKSSSSINKTTSISSAGVTRQSKSSTGDKTITPQETGTYQVCPLCSGHVKDDAALEVHMRVVHSLLSSSDVMVCWLCPDKRHIPRKVLLAHLFDHHAITMGTMLQLRQCSLCSSMPTMTKVSAFENHMLSQHPTLFSSAEMLWRFIEESSPSRHHVKYGPDGTLQCRLCSSNFISRSYLCRHAYMVHDGIACNCAECCPTDHVTKLTTRRAHTSPPAVAVVISDDEDDQVVSKKIKLSNERVKRETDNDRKQCLQSLLNRDDGAIMDRIEEVLEIDGEMVLIVQERTDDEDGGVDVK